MHCQDSIVSAESLGAATDVVWLDARPGAEGARAYADGHIAGARHFELERDLSRPTRDPSQGGRHPLPEVETFCALLGRAGITPDSHVVIYDDQGGANAAARLWWMLRALGHRKAQVLDGGFDAARAAGLPITTHLPDPAPAAPYPATAFDAMPRADAAEVDAARQDPKRRVLDVRAAYRYRGEREPIDPIAGHIPGAHNVPLSDNLNDAGRFKSSQALQALYTLALDGRNPDDCIVHCGSGVTACHTLLAMEHAGLPGAALYVGSWSEWCRNPSWPREP